MTEPMAHAPRPFVLQGAKGPLFALYFAPRPGTHPRGDVLVVPAFAEEMNRCRAMVTLQAQAWAALGIGTLVVDPCGTGDSGGEFSDGDWDGWRDDLERGLRWLREQGNGCVALLGVRLGAIMAAELAQRMPQPVQLLFWQPVLNGKVFLTQFLRIRLAAEIDQADGIKSTDELRRMAAAGQCVEVSGYPLSPALIASLDRLVMPKPADLRPAALHWFEVIADTQTALPRASTKSVEEFRAGGIDVGLGSVVGPPFWQVHERELAPDLITATTGVLASLPPLSAERMASPDAMATHDASVVQAAAGESPIVFRCGDVNLVGMLHAPATEARPRGVIVVVAGGPQYRAGAHRQFVNLARKLTNAGFPVLRFDLRGMGDSGGSYLGFEHSETDIRAAIDALAAREPRVREFVLFGECESASGILFYAWQDPRVAAAVLVNPWVRTSEGQAQVIIKHYYWDRLRSPEFWKSVREGRYDVVASVRSFFDVARTYLRGRRSLVRATSGAGKDDISGLPLPEKTAAGLRRFSGRVLLLMSGRDYIAREFDEVTAMSRAWHGLLQEPRIERRDLTEADHTFSRAAWKAQASDWVVEWLRGF